MSDIGSPAAPAAPAPAPSVAPALGVPNPQAAVNDSAGSSFAKAVTGNVGSTDAQVFDALYGPAASPSDYTNLELGQHFPDMPLRELSQLNRDTAEFVHGLGLSPNLATRYVNSVMQGQRQFDSLNPTQQEAHLRTQGLRLKQILGDKTLDAVNEIDKVFASEWAQKHRGGVLSVEALSVLALHNERKALRATMK